MAISFAKVWIWCRRQNFLSLMGQEGLSDLVLQFEVGYAQKTIL